MRKLTFLLCCLLIAALSLPTLAKEIKGVVVDKKTNAPLPGANVYIRGTTFGAATDINGRFSFSYEPTRSFNLTVSYIGYKTEVRTLSPSEDLTNLRFEMIEDVFRGEEIVVTGIASKTAKSVAEVAVARLTANQLTTANSYQEISQLIAGKVAGVNIAPASGNVGGAIRFNVRSGGGLNGNEQPVIYIDGVRVDNSEVIGFGVGGQGTSTLAD
ncbi:MAG: carboxypeptidase-like regulatory domain-containing protein, partial [candidate division KSB1 bacterium]|nr:carboxypeptidase-like regulatory domain-containing protein [candidate division KSB1 bacterium]